MITIDLLNTSDPINKVRKSTSAYASFTGDLKENCSILKPVVTVKHTGAILANYAYISTFDRYYFVDDVTILTNELQQIKLSVDPLYSHAAGLLACPCIVAKNQSDFNLYLNDSNYKCLQYPILMAVQFPRGFDLDLSKFVLTLIGDKVPVS